MMKSFRAWLSWLSSFLLLSTLLRAQNNAQAITMAAVVQFPFEMDGLVLNVLVPSVASHIVDDANGGAV